MKMFTFKAENRDVDQNHIDRRLENENALYDSALTVLYTAIFLIGFMMAGSFLAEKLVTFEKDIQKSFRM